MQRSAFFFFLHKGNKRSTDGNYLWLKHAVGNKIPSIHCSLRYHQVAILSLLNDIKHNFPFQLRRSSFFLYLFSESKKIFFHAISQT
jgi:hypothetical protein